MRTSTCLNQIIGRKLAHVHGSEWEEAKQLPSLDNIEMSTMVNSKIVYNDSEGQSTSFKRTDAILAWNELDLDNSDSIWMLQLLYINCKYCALSWIKVIFDEIISHGA